MIFTSHDLAMGTGGHTVHDAGPGKVCTDTRKIEPGDWFLALRGERFDAHDFLDKAIELGAGGVIAEEVPADWTAGYVRVSDGLQALQNLGKYVRNQFDGPTVGVTGSAGKTTSRALIALALEELGLVHQTAGNFNNHIGLPLTLLDAPPGAAAWVLEMGMNHAGEIDLLQEIGRPNVRLITNVGAAHLEGLGSIEAVAAAKGELFDGAQPGDICCINMDDPFVSALPLPPGVDIIRYGSSSDCDVRLLSAKVDPVSLATEFDIQTPKGNATCSLPSPGIHMAHNATGAICVGTALGLELNGMVERIARYEPVGMRLRIEEGPRGIRVINDAYNANPMSVAANLRTLAAIPPESGIRRIALLGDMLELGPTEIEQHREIVDLCEQLELDIVAFVGPRFTEAVDQRHICAPSAPILAEQIRDDLRPGDIVLIKGSRGMAMEQVLQGLEHKETI
ncbi:MAG: UDP-N-acetylmuramoyl-tripeptide--D-alanyl-D-alanine ligase [Myxococcota bacterium]